MPGLQLDEHRHDFDVELVNLSGCQFFLRFAGVGMPGLDQLAVQIHRAVEHRRAFAWRFHQAAVRCDEVSIADLG